MASTDLLTVNQLRQNYGFTIAPSSDNEALYARLISAASLACLKFIGRDIHLRTVVQIIDGNGNDRFLLDETPVVSVVSLSIDSARAFTTILGTTTYRVDPDTGIVTLYSQDTPDLKDCIRVEYTAGYEEIPEDVVAAVVDTVQMMARRVTGVAAGVTSRSMPDGGTEQLETMAPTDFAKFLLRPYRRNYAR